MSSGIRRKQHVNHHQDNLYQVFEEDILRTTGVRCSVLVKPECVSIRAADYTDFVLAKGAISGKTGLPIVRDLSCNLPPKLP